MSLTGYVVRRLLQAVPVVLGVTILVFFLIHLIPDDPREPRDAEERRAAAARLGSRPSLAGAVRQVHGPVGARRSRLVALLRSRRRPPRPRAAAGHALADLLRRRALGADRGTARLTRREPARSGGGSPDPRRAARGARLPALLDRDHAPPPVRAPPGPSISRGRLRRRVLRPPALDVPAGVDRRARALSDPDPQPARRAARSARGGLHHDRPLEGAVGAAGAHAPRP